MGSVASPGPLSLVQADSDAVSAMHEVRELAKRTLRNVGNNVENNVEEESSQRL